MRRTFRTQLILTIISVVFVAIALISLLANIFINREFEKYMQEQQKIRVEETAAMLSLQYNSLTKVWNLEYIHGVAMAAMHDGYIIRLFDINDNVIWDTEEHSTAECSQIMTDIIERMEKKRPALNGEFVSHEYELKQNNQKVGSLVIQYYGPYFLNESDYQFLNSLNLIFLVVGSFSFLLSLFAAGILAKRFSKPIMKTSHIAKQIAGGNYNTRFLGRSKIRELDELISAFNHMAASLENEENLRKRLTDDVAHELRTPLAAVSFHLEAMMEGVWEPTPHRLQSCYEEIERISGLVSDLESLAKVEKDNLQLERVHVDLLELAHTVAGNFVPESAKKDISISVEGKVSHVSADKDRLNQVLTNLLSNAIKYTNEGGEIYIEVQDTEEYGVLTVRDNGIGIPNQDLPFVFERLYRTDLSRNRLTGGVGIGLAIVKSIVAAHGGTVRVESEVEQGSRFIVTIPK